MKRTPQVSCVIPFYNEGERLAHVLEAVTRVGNLDQVLCVDDGSEEDMTRVLKDRFPGVEFLRLPENQGKTGAVREGVRAARGDLVLLLDADLKNLRAGELEAAVAAMQKGGIDLLILRRVNASFVVRLVRGDVLFSGERILFKRDLEQILAAPIRNWELEAAMNAYMLTNRRRVVWMPYSATNTHKQHKMGLWRSFTDDLRTRRDIISGAGFPGFLRQLRYFAKERLPLSGPVAKAADETFVTRMAALFIE